MAGYNELEIELPGSREVIDGIRGPKRHRVLGTEGRWVEVQLRGDNSGWVDLYLLTYEGPHSSSLGRGLEPLFVSNRTDLEFVFGSMIEETQGLKNPDDESSYSCLVPAKAEITVLEEVTGSKKYGSGRWLLIYYVDDLRVKKVYVPVEAVVER